MSNLPAVPALDPARWCSLEPTTERERRVRAILDVLAQRWPARFELDARNAYEMLIATVLAARTLDRLVNERTKELFARYPDAAALAQAMPDEIEPLIQGVMSFRQKAKYLVQTAQQLVHEHGGQVPDRLDDLVQLPGVGRKTALMVLGTSFDRHEGIPVDTHVHRVAQRLGLTATDDPEAIEAALLALVPPAERTATAQRLVLHGRYTCIARKPACATCEIAQACPSRGHAEPHE